jgi:hypothetical protein
MANNTLNSKWLLRAPWALALLALGFVSGCCCQAVPLPAENQCPTDARALYLACGEEAVRRCPCGPDRDYYGLKPTSWRSWPEGWNASGYPPMPGGMACGECGDGSCDGPASTDVDFSNPFRGKGAIEVLPQPTLAPEQKATPATPPKTAPVEKTPAKEPAAPAPLPEFEMAPAELTLPKDEPKAIEPAEKSPAEKAPTESKEPAVKALPTPPQATAEQPPTARVTPIESAPALPTPPQSSAPVIPPQDNSPKAAEPTKNESPATAPAKDANDQASAPKFQQPERKAPDVSKRVQQHLLKNLNL